MRGDISLHYLGTAAVAFPSDPDQWKFYVVPANQRALSKSKAIATPVKLEQLSKGIETTCSWLTWPVARLCRE